MLYSIIIWFLELSWPPNKLAQRNLYMITRLPLPYQYSLIGQKNNKRKPKVFLIAR